MSTFDIAQSISNKVNTRWWEKRETEQLTEWQELKDPSTGQFYFFNSVTKEVTWDRPAELMTTDELDQGSGWVWVEDDDLVFIPARILSQNKNETIVQDQNGRQRSIVKKKGESTQNFEPLKRSSLQRIVQDLVLLDSMEVPLILHNLRERFQKNEIYTHVGTILIAINPYKVLPLYTDDIIRKYAHRRLGEEMPPHSFNIAHEAFVGLRDFNSNQSIIISGESGAGKTESTKHCLNYLTFMAGTGSGNVAEKILETNPILESIGNAKTTRNDNSSRFGKYMQLFFRGKQCSISGCTIKTYLLEKIRVVQQGPNERNFHIFYQVLAGADDAMKKALFLDTSPKDCQATSYTYLKTCTVVDTIDDKREFADLIEGFDKLGFSKDLQTQIFQIIASIAKMGNITFAQDDNQYSFINMTNADNDRYVTNISKLLQVDPQALQQVLITKELRIKNQTTTIMKLNKVQASQSRDAFAKFIYGYLFDWIVLKLNQAIGQPSDQSKFIGCLDIFGFEIFETNSFEQLCINFTNEMLQQHFNYQTFKLEEQVYKQEQIVFKHVDFIDNQPMLDLISYKPQQRAGVATAAMGLLPQLDEELIVVKGSDAGFYTKIVENHSTNPVFQKHPKSKTTFIIKHYAGFVAYDTVGFLEKNRDILTEDCIDLLRTSTHPLIQIILPQQVSQQEKKASLGSQFRRQLDELMITLRLTEPWYIRCIKPNPNKAQIEFYPRLCHEQLTYSGVYEATKIRKLGYPFRLQNQKFVERYSVLFDSEVAPGNNVKDKCIAIITHMKLNKENIQIGVSMVLYRAEEHKMLELHRNIKVRLRETHEELARLVKIDPSSLTTEHDKEQFFIELAGTVRAADEFRIKTPVSEQARKLLDKYVEERMDQHTKQQLQEALRNKDKTVLEKVLRHCESNGYQTSLVRECGLLYESISDCEMALSVSIQQMNEEFLTRSLEMFNQIKYLINGQTPPQVVQAQQLFEKIQRVSQMLTSALRSLNHEHLKKAIEFAQGFGFNDSKVAAAKKKYNQVMQIRDILTSGKKSINLTELKEGLAQAKDIGYECDLVDECRLLLWRCQRIEQEGEKAFQTLNDADIRAILKAANEVGYPTKSNKNLKKLKSLIDGPLLDYYNAQLDCAKKIGDHERAISLTMMLAQEKIQTQPAAFPIAQFRLLKDPMFWGNEKWWGSAKHRAETMLSYNDAYIHAPITTNFQNMPEPRKSDLTEKVLLVHENIQKIMLMRNSKRLPQRHEEIFMLGADYIELRDEIYIGIIKSVTNNKCETPGSVDLGFELMTLCLLCFPPSTDFVHHLYWWLQQPQCRVYNERWNMTFLLARISYMNAVISPIWGARSLLDNMTQVINHCIPKQMWYYDEQKASKDIITTFDDLKIKYNDPNFEEKATKAYERSKKAEKKGLCANVVPVATKKAFETQLTERRNAHMQRQQGVTLIIQPPEFAGEHAMISQQISRPQTIATASKAALDASEDDDDDDEEESRASKSKSKGKKGKKGAASAKDSAPAPPSSSKGKKTLVVQQDSEEEEPEPSVSKKKSAKKATGKKAVIVQQDSDDEPEPIKKTTKKTVPPPKKKSSLMFGDESDEEVASPRSSKGKKGRQ